FFSSRRRHTRSDRDWSSDVCSSDLDPVVERGEPGPVLTAIANHPGDILVIGAGRRGTLARVFSGRVSRYCLAHGHAPIVAIPPPDRKSTRLNSSHDQMPFAVFCLKN